MMSSFTHEFSLPIYNVLSNHIGDIDVRVEYTVETFGCAASVNCLPEDAHPAEPAEIGVVIVEMLNAPKSGRKPILVDVWDWLYDDACDWCDEHAAELAAAASLEIASNREDYADTQRG